MRLIKSSVGKSHRQLDDDFKIDRTQLGSILKPKLTGVMRPHGRTVITVKKIWPVLDHIFSISNIQKSSVILLWASTHMYVRLTNSDVIWEWEQQQNSYINNIKSIEYEVITLPLQSPLVRNRHPQQATYITMINRNRHPHRATYVTVIWYYIYIYTWLYTW